MVVRAMADFSYLAYPAHNHNANANTAYLSEHIAAQPMVSDSLLLRPGVHLHWSLPDALTRSHPIRESSDRIEFPAVPTCWLIERRDAGRLVRRWIVESDFLWPVDEAENAAAAGSRPFPIFPFEPNKSDDKPPFRYLGRCLNAKDWTADIISSEQYRTTLTALGYGEPNFAAFYPNCPNVFGFHDPDHPAADGETSYAVMGWYRLAENDPCHGGLSPEDLAGDYGWIVSAPRDPAERCDKATQTLLAGEVRLASGAGSPHPSFAKDLELAVGNTATEALSALLAQKDVARARADGRSSEEIEDQLEALHLAGDLEHRSIDVGAKFREARHHKGFRAVDGGSLWVVRALKAAGAKADAAHTQPHFDMPEDLMAEDSETPLKTAIAHALNALNLAQQAYDRRTAQLQNRRERLYADWYHYMLIAYPLDARYLDLPDIDQVKDLIERQTLARVIEEEQALAVAAAELAGQQAAMLAKLEDAQLFAASDIYDLNAFARELAAREESLLSPMRDAMARITEPSAKRAYLTGELNRLLTGGDLKDLFKLPAGHPPEASVPKSAEEAGRDRHAISFRRANRIVLQAVFPSLGRRPPLQLHQVAAPRYFEPTEPVVLLHGEAVAPTDRHGHGQTRDGKLDCALIELDTSPQAMVLGHRSAELQTLADRLFGPGGLVGAAGRRECRHRPWTPFMLDWEFEFTPMRDFQDAYDYLPEQIAKTHELDSVHVDLAERAGETGYQFSHLYLGRCLLSPHAKPALLDQLDVFLQSRLAKAYWLSDKAHQAEELTSGYYAKHRDAILDWFDDAADRRLGEAEVQGEEAAARERLLRHMVKVRHAVSDWQRQEPTFHVLSQALTGFNAALLGHKTTMQLPVADPLALPDAAGLPELVEGPNGYNRPLTYREFAHKVAEKVGGANRVSPVLLDEFAPLRAGRLAIKRLRLIDTFGQWRDVEPKGLARPHAMIDPTDPAKIKLAPRFAMPLRLELRWLASDNGEIEMNAHPATTPVCGWLVVNELDESLWVYRTDGKALGYLDRNCQWRRAPTPSGIETLEAIANPHLKRTIVWLRRPEDEAGRRDKLSDFISTINNAQRSVEPASTYQHAHVSLLIGRPVAIVRAQVQLRQRGLIPIDHGALAFRQDVEDGRRHSRRIERVRVPLRIGEHRQLDDGVLGYFLEGNEGEIDVMRSPQFEREGDAPLRTGKRHIATYNNASLEEMHLEVSLDAAPERLTVLFDPRGKLHATTGVLPVKVIDIPPDQFKPALEALEIGFVATGILTPQRTNDADDPAVELPVPEEPGYHWGWIDTIEDKEPGGVGRPDPDANFRHRFDLRDGWLLLQRGQSEVEIDRDGETS